MLSALALAAALVAALSTTSDSCRPTSAGDAGATLRRAADVTGLTGLTTPMHVDAFDVRGHDYESDRTYGPYLVDVTRLDRWFDPTSGVERVASHTTIAGNEYPGGTTIGDARGSYALRDTTLVASDEVHTGMYTLRPLNVWAVLIDWLASPDVRTSAMCDYRDYSRLVLTRRGQRGEERLFIDQKSGYPVKLERVEPHYLWGQIHVEYVYSTWQRVGNSRLPGESFRLEDGEVEVARTYGAVRFSRRDSAPPLAVPARSQPMSLAIPAFLAPTNPDTVRVSGTAFLLRNRGYTGAVTLVRDTVFIFDASQGEQRARQDSSWIARLFPGTHPIVLVVTDLAWPHLAGARFWVARGATIVSHRASRAFLERVVNRRWTSNPDLLERTHPRPKLRFRPVADSASMGGGKILLFPIDGAASEVAIAAFVRDDGFLWASDFIQRLDAPSQYADETSAAVRRVGITPSKFAAAHVSMTPWSRVEALTSVRPVQ